MTITTRSKRVTPFGAAATPSAVGPGAYAPEKAASASSFNRAGNERPQFSGFATSEKRQLNENRTTSAFTPGPGAYLAAEAPATKAPSNVFATKIARFAPSAPGSSAFCPSSIQDNPGPGAYDISQRSNQSSHEVAAFTSNPSNAATKPSSVDSVPTIPKKHQSFGYVHDTTTGTLVRQAPPAGAVGCSGVGQDTVGPAAYAAHPSLFFDARKNAAPSLRSTVARDVWCVDPSMPGPGAYGDQEEDDRAAADAPGVVSRREAVAKAARARRQRLAAQPSAVFASAVPLLAPHAKPAAQFDADRDLEVRAKQARADQRAAARRVNSKKVEAFGSTTTRVDLAAQRHPGAAFTSPPTFLTTPGPGKYDGDAGGHTGGPQPGVGFNIGTLPIGLGTSHRTPRRHRPSDGVGFSSAAARACLAPAPVANSRTPGPGAYRNSETPRSLDHGVKAKLTVGRLGAFGSTAERNVWGALDSVAPIQGDMTPGPGAYISTAESACRSAPSAAFKSGATRFVPPTATPGVGEYDLLPRSPRAMSSDAGGPAFAGFRSSAARDSVFDARSDDAPGPGTYDRDAFSANSPRATLGNDPRFRVKPTVPETVGPGAYAIPGTVGTKSFNVTMTPATSINAQLRRHRAPRRRISQ